MPLAIIPDDVTGQSDCHSYGFISHAPHTHLIDLLCLCVRHPFSLSFRHTKKGRKNNVFTLFSSLKYCVFHNFPAKENTPFAVF
jgi:hypothetical protein